MLAKLLLAAMLWGGAMTAALAETVEMHGVSLPTSVELAGEKLTLNGAGLREQFFVNVYIGSLYLPQPSQNPAAILAMPGPKRIQLDLVRDVSQSQLAEAMRDGFRSNLSDAELERFQADIERLEAMLEDGKAGDQVQLDLVPGEGVRVTHSDKVVGTIANEAFYPQLLKIWIGDEPSDESLKRGMLGR